MARHATFLNARRFNSECGEALNSCRKSSGYSLRVSSSPVALTNDIACALHVVIKPRACQACQHRSQAFTLPINMSCRIFPLVLDLGMCHVLKICYLLMDCAQDVFVCCYQVFLL
ncbi:hypothetical protein NDU88_006136 [Pleurodeles waltl]|uniref:Uncharacterized protein n=1 Tax=Pleurodeles waltl TaxID=8319 RepID=A0AAV7TDB3_PLEWA|nr:hypothetical protein NDU88_006136 [Pleurodeles waltl]